MFSPSPKLLGKLEIHDLPSLNQVLTELIHVCNQEEVAFEEMSEIIKKDTSLTARVLTIVNSPAFAKSREVTSLQRALVSLGLETVKLIAVTASLRQVLSKYHADHVLDMKWFWRNSLFSALLAKSLAKLIGYKLQSEAYVTGLMHNVGMLVMASNFPTEYQYLAGVSGKQLSDTERKQFGFTSCEVGAWLVDQWKLRSFAADAILYQHEPIDQMAGAHELVRMISLVSFFSATSEDASGYGAKMGQRFFGLTPNLMDRLVTEANRQLTAMAESMSIDLGDISESSNAQIHDGMSDRRRNGLSLLAEKLLDDALLNSVRPLFLAGQERSRVLRNIELTMQVLFGIQQALVFLVVPEMGKLVGASGEGGNKLLNHLRVSRSDSNSVLVESLTNRRPMHCFDDKFDSNVSVIDRQIVNISGNKGVLVLPLLIKEDEVGVLALGLDRSKLAECEKRYRLFMELAALSASSLSSSCHKAKKVLAADRDSHGLDREKLQKLVHEASNPLSILKNYIEILGSKLDGQHQKELQIINSEIDRVKRIIRRIDQTENSQPTETFSTDINSVIHNLASVFQETLFKPNKVEFKFIADPALQEIDVNEDAFKQVVLNLIKNAAEATPEYGKIKVTTKQEVVFRRKSFIEVTVSDTGSGIPEDIQRQLFQPVKSNKEEGLGIGLVIVKNLVGEMGGLVNFKSRIGEGTIFQVLIPRQ